MIHFIQGWPKEATFPYKGGQCHVRFFVNWTEDAAGKVTVTSFEPMWEVAETVWAAFVEWAEGRKTDWAADIEAVAQDARETEANAWWRGL